jgi:hypothetical protein
MMSKREKRIQNFLLKIGMPLDGGTEASFEGVVHRGVCAIEALEEIRESLG